MCPGLRAKAATGITALQIPPHGVCELPVKMKMTTVKMLGVGLRKGPRGQDQASRLREAKLYPQNKVSH